MTPLPRKTTILSDQAFRDLRQREEDAAIERARPRGNLKELHREQYWSEVRRLGHALVHESRMFRATLNIEHHREWKMLRRLLKDDLGKWRSNYDACLVEQTPQTNAARDSYYKRRHRDIAENGRVVAEAAE